MKNLLDPIIKEFDDFFGYSVGEINATFLQNRQEIDNLRGEKTPNWLVGWVDDSNRIFMLSKDNFEKESCHKKEDFEGVLKHEVAHIYIDKGGIKFCGNH